MHILFAWLTWLVRHSATRCCTIALAVLSLLAPRLAQAADVEVKTSRVGDVVSVQALASISAPMAVVWGTLTDYERLPEFVPGLKKSKIVARNGAMVTVQQSGEARFFFSRVPIEVTLESTEAPPNSIDVRRVAGTIKRLDGRYETQALPAAGDQPAMVQLRWTGHIEPENGLPPLVGEALMRRVIRQQFVGMVREIERREGVRQQGLQAAPTAAVTAAAPSAPAAPPVAAPLAANSTAAPATTTAPATPAAAVSPALPAASAADK